MSRHKVLFKCPVQLTYAEVDVDFRPPQNTISSAFWYLLNRAAAGQRLLTSSAGSN